MASLSNPSRFSHLDGPCNVWVDQTSFVEAFFKSPSYDPAIVAWAETNKAPTGLMESLTVQIGRTPIYALGFEGPVMLLSGEYDLLACDGNCGGGFLEAGLEEMFPAAKERVTVVHAGAGHAVNFCLNATGAYEVVLGVFGAE